VIVLELACVAIVGLYFFLAARSEPFWPLARRMALVAIAGWVGEDTLIRVYGFYAYEGAAWFPFVDRVPLLIACIWPVVIDSARALARDLVGPRAGAARTACVGGLIVLADASLIEPIAVRAGLWHWTRPGLFDVPAIGVLGWAAFAFLVIGLFEARVREPLVVALAPLGTHLVLVALWWSVFAWAPAPIAPWPSARLAWAASLVLAGSAWRGGVRARVPVARLLVRAPGALFFFVLLARLPRTGGDAEVTLALGAYAAAFVPPYLALFDVGRVRSGYPETSV
jgi:hypothetical protein